MACQQNAWQEADAAMFDNTSIVEIRNPQSAIRNRECPGVGR